MFINQNQEENFRDVFCNHVNKMNSCLSVMGVNDTLIAYLTSQLHNFSKKTIMLVVETSEDVQRYIEEVSFFGKDEIKNNITYFPAYNISGIKPYNDVSSNRIACLHKLLENKTNLIIVTDLSALRQKVIPKEVLIRYTDLIEIDEEINTEKFIDKLICGGYRKKNIVEDFGDFSVRSSIIDFFPPLYQNPIRIEIFGNSIKSIRFFSPKTQRSIENIDQITILPACETVFERDNKNKIIANIRAMAIKQGLLDASIRKILNNIRDDSFSDMEKVKPLLYNGMDSFFDYLPMLVVYVTVDRAKLLLNISGLEDESKKNLKSTFKSGELTMNPDDLFLNYQIINQKILSQNSIDYKLLRTDDIVKSELSCCSNINTTKAINNNNPVIALLNVLSDNKAKGYLSILVCDSQNQINTIEALLLKKGLKVTININFSDKKINDSSINICLGNIRSGFILQANYIAVISYNEIFNVKPNQKKNPIGFKVESIALENIRNGELVVHTDHGIGKYIGLVKLKIDSVISEFLLIKYRDDAKLYLPVERMGLLQKYIWLDEDFVPALDKMGGKIWRNIKNKARYAAEKIAGDLLKTYANRKIKSGHSFLCDDKSLSKFELQFKHEETPDQLKAIKDVLIDMSKDIPMDRLVCGDVGYGKTEVALRASFVAISEAKQVAVLVPTTVLAEQHFSTFSARFDEYPVKISCLSRFKSRKEQKYLIKGIKEGLIDIIIGTHRLLQNDIVFKDLGLVILDEEQRFGVKDKEKLKKLRTSVDILALSATPIPRTLYLSLIGIRDISVISTPPEQRCPIITYVCEFNYDVVSTAIRKELGRGGQIFFIHNNISSIQIMARNLKDNVPEVRMAVLHGQMSEEKVECVMIDFVKGNIDMLVCTTIIESGIDIARANTIMVNRADRFGLAQIYQIRGRVGRSTDQAYAYLFVPKDELLSDKASKRLKVLLEHSDLSSGFEIAMKDMKIRGGGSILGDSQSGHMAAIGYEMFLELMEEAVAELKGNPLKKYIETEVNVPVSAFISENYIPGIDHRFSMYRRLANIKELKELVKLKEELIDRFGPMPNETKTLLLKIMLKVLACNAGVKKIDIVNQQVVLFFNKEHYSDLQNFNKRNDKKMKITKIREDGIVVLELTEKSMDACLLKVKNILIEFLRHVRRASSLFI